MKPLTIEKTINTSPEIVWTALTDKEQMKQWFFDVDDFKPEVGFKFHFHGENEGRHFFHICVVKEATTNTKLSFSWKYKNYPGESFVAIQLLKAGEKTKIKLTHSGLETFPQDNPDFSIKNFTAGWKYILGKSLTGYINNIHS